MGNIRQVAIVGAGAMGAAYAAMFTDAVGFDVCFLARGQRYERLKNKSYLINNRLYHFNAVHADTVAEPADLVIVSLKHHQLAGAVKDIQKLVGPQTAILSVMNGLESEAIIGAACGMDKLVYAIAVGIDAVHQNDRFTYANPGKIIFGPATEGGDNGPSLDRIQEALNRAAIPNEVPSDIMRAMWWKFMVNVGINQTSAVLGAPYAVFHASNEARELMRSLMAEVVLLAQHTGIDLSNKDLDEWDDILMTLSPSGKTSMLQDVEAGRKTEVEIFGGHVVALGDKYHIATPVNATVVRIIKVIEYRSGR